jgi:hypothetical protein
MGKRRRKSWNGMLKRRGRGKVSEFGVLRGDFKENLPHYQWRSNAGKKKGLSH